MAKYVTIQVTRKEPPPAPEAAGERCKKCSTALLPGDLEQNLRVCPHCAYHYPLPAHERVAQLADRGTRHLHRRGAARGRPAGVRRPQALPGTDVGGAGQDRPDRGVPGRVVRHRRPAGRAGGARLQLPGRLHGLGGGRALLPLGAGRGRAAAAHGRGGRLGRGAHAGGAFLAHADGKDRGGGAVGRPRPVFPTSPSSPIPPREACSRASPPWPTSSWPSRER